MSSPTRTPCPHCPGDSAKSYSVPHGLKVHIGRKHKHLLSHDSAGSLHVAPAVRLTQSCADPTAVTLKDLATLKNKVQVLKHVPKGARCLAAGKLSAVIERCLQTNSADDWLKLLSFAFTALKMPEQGDRKSLTAKVKANIEDSQLDIPVGPVSYKAPSLYKSVQAKVYEGDLRGAARLLTSDCTFAPSDEGTLDALKDKHPSPSRPPYVPPAPDLSTPCLTVKTEDVTSALQSFNRGSAAGLDGLRPEHLRELVSPSAGDNGPRLLESLVRLCNFLLRGELNPEICPFLYGGTLCALQKKDGGVRPIAVGSTFRRLVAKLCCHAVKDPMARYLQPQQVGFGSPLGCEAAIHATRAFVMREGSDNVLLKLDIRNAFNCVERDIMLAEVRDLIPAIFPFLQQCYSIPSSLIYDGTIIVSQVGAQQGDPLGPLIFSLAIHKTISSLQSPLNIWYLDDGTIGGSPESVERDVGLLFPALRALGLEVNTTKCEFFPCSPAALESSNRLASLIPGMKIVDRGSLSLLGAPIFSEGVGDALQAKTKTLASLAVHFRNLPAHVSLTLLRSCFSMPKLNYIIRATPTWKFPEEVLHFDETLKQILEEILNIYLSENQWCQASLPVRYGGLGVRRLRETGPLAFLASSYGVAELVALILPDNGDIIRVPYAEEALGVWSALCPCADPPERPKLQRGWDDVLSKWLLCQLREKSSGVVLAQLNAATRPESGAWLHALPSPHIGTLLDDDSLRVATALRLGCSVCEPHICICGASVDANGHHGLSCTRSAGRRPRHHALNELIRRALVSAEVPCVLEPPGLSRLDGRRPDGLTLIPWQRGRCLLWDATCVSTFAACYLPATQQSAGAGAEAAAQSKHLKYACLESAYDFVPFAVETAGPWCSEAKKFVMDLGRRLREKGRDPRSGSYLVQHISLAIQRGNAASIMGTFGQGSIRGGLFD